MLLTDVDYSCSFDHIHWHSNVDCHWFRDQKLSFDLGYSVAADLVTVEATDDNIDLNQGHHYSKMGQKSKYLQPSLPIIGT